jgi:hypothetical protein
MGAGIDVRCRPLDTVSGIRRPKRKNAPAFKPGRFIFCVARL